MKIKNKKSSRTKTGRTMRARFCKRIKVMDKAFACYRFKWTCEMRRFAICFIFSFFFFLIGIWKKKNNFFFRHFSFFHFYNFVFSLHVWQSEEKEKMEKFYATKSIVSIWILFLFKTKTTTKILFTTHYDPFLTAWIHSACETNELECGNI